MSNKQLEKLNDLNILLVEDNEELTKTLSATLSVFFKEVFTAVNGAEGYKIYQEQQVDMIITDYVMPIMDGYELCKKIREDKGSVPIAILSNYSDKEKLLKAIPLHLAQYLVKPVDYNSLVTLLLTMLEDLESQKPSTQEINRDISYSYKEKKLITKTKEYIHLTKNEITIIELFLENKNTLITKETISYALDPLEAVDENAIKNFIFRLRKKLGKESIINLKNLGYMLKIE